MNQKDAFIEVAQELNLKLQELPIIYGSVGLGRILKQDLNAEDIDLLVRDELVEEKWSELQATMEQIGYTLQNEHEHEFVKNGATVAFAPERDVKRLTGESADTLQTTEEGGARFRELSAELYLKIYEYLQADDYRQKTGKAEKDKKKIELIKEFLKTNPKLFSNS